MNCPYILVYTTRFKYLMENLDPKMEIEHALDMHYCPWKNFVSSCISSPPLLKLWWDTSLGWLLDAEAEHSFTVITYKFYHIFLDPP